MFTIQSIAVWLSLVMLVLPAPSEAQNDGSAAAQPVFSAPAAEVLRMAEAGVAEDVLVAYVKNSDGRFELSADDILYMKDQGISTSVVTEMLNHDAQTRTYTYEQKLYTPTTPVAPPPPPSEAAPVQAEPSPAPETAAPAAVPPPAYVNDAPPQVAYFYNDLAPYGTWVNLEGYGWCWQPRVVVLHRDWRPYCDSGHWVYTDAGWYWQSEYSWGWAPFHYGRWHYHERVGWVWFPDTVWAPSWVVWRTSGEHCGWAPLPYRAEFDVREGFRFNGVRVRADFDFGLDAGLFTFIAFRDFDRHDYRQHCLPPEEVKRVYVQTTIINNYVINENHTVVNRGFPKEHVEAATHAKLPVLALHTAPAGQKGHGAPAAAGVVYKHELKAPAQAPRMIAQKVDEHHPFVRHAALATQREVPKSTATLLHSKPAQPTPRAGGNTASSAAQTHPFQHVPSVPAHQLAPTTHQAQSATSAFSGPVPSHQTTHVPATSSGKTMNTAVLQPYVPLTVPNPNPHGAAHGSSPVVTRSPAAIPPNSQFYYPKTYHQVTEVHSGAPVVQSQSAHLPPVHQAPPSWRSQTPQQHPSNGATNIPGK